MTTTMLIFTYLLGAQVVAIIALAGVDAHRYQAWKDRHARALDPMDRFSWASSTEVERRNTWNALRETGRRNTWIGFLVVTFILTAVVAVVVGGTLIAVRRPAPVSSTCSAAPAEQAWATTERASTSSASTSPLSPTTRSSSTRATRSRTSPSTARSEEH